MTIAIVHENVDPTRGGAETSVVEMARCLVAQGADVCLIHAGAARGDDSPQAELAHRAIPAPGLSKLARTRAFVAGAAAATARGFDIVHAITPLPRCDLYQPRGGTYVETVRRTVGRVRSPLLRALKTWSRSLNFRQQLLMRVEREMLSEPQAPWVAPVSAYGREHLLADFPRLDASRVRVVFNGVDVEPWREGERARLAAGARASLGVAAEMPLVLFVAHNFTLKGLRELIGCMPRVRLPFELVVAGRDDPRPFRRLASTLGVGERVRFVGAAPTRPLNAAADVLAHPTWYDPCSRVVLEALSLGVPVVTTRLNGAAEAIGDDSDGIVVESPADETELAKALDALLAHAAPAAADRMARAHERLSMRRHASELMALYHHIIGARR